VQPGGDQRFEHARSEALVQRPQALVCDYLSRTVYEAVVSASGADDDAAVLKAFHLESFFNHVERVDGDFGAESG